ncbi:MAG TPA: oxygenase MpaB family protein, partial [Gemmatimonadales bacterium]|nr:oxygenase MpaB family protein [Gemmatimonadales bacterium]
ADAPPELVAFIKAMETTPDWLDMELVEKGARAARIPAAFLSPFVLRGAFLGTFTNTYSALPMTLTGALSSRRAAHRVHETASFFSGTTMPHALDRYGTGFEAAAMVRLMHSMVRYNALQRSDKWDVAIYGMPVPQVDQMPAGLMNVYILAAGALRRGRTEFNARERAILEFARYRCFLLGLPEDLLPTTPADVVHVFHARGALLRADYDDTICGELVRSTMDAYLRPTDSWFDRAANSVEKSWSKMGFAQAFCRGDRKAAARMNVHISRADQLRVAITAPFILGRFFGVMFASRSRILRGPADRYTTRVLKKRLAMYGVPEFTTDAKHYPNGQLGA